MFANWELYGMAILGGTAVKIYDDINDFETKPSDVVNYFLVALSLATLITIIYNHYEFGVIMVIGLLFSKLADVLYTHYYVLASDERESIDKLPYKLAIYLLMPLTVFFARNFSIDGVSELLSRNWFILICAFLSVGAEQALFIEEYSSYKLLSRIAIIMFFCAFLWGVTNIDTIVSMDRLGEVANMPIAHYFRNLFESQKTTYTLILLFCLAYFTTSVIDMFIFQDRLKEPTEPVNSVKLTNYILDKLKIPHNPINNNINTILSQILLPLY